MKTIDKVLLFTGAGVNFPWNGATSEAITKKLTDNNRFYSLIKEHLSKNIERPINFEDIISTIDNLFLFYRGKQHLIDSEIPIIFEVKSDLAEYINRHCFAGNQLDFIEEMFYGAINIIVKQISDYSIIIDEKGESNDLLADFLKRINKNNIIRAYTTNYDRLFIDVCNQSKNHKITFSDGFIIDTNIKSSGSENIDEGERLRGLRLENVLNQRNINCYYNLHGSIYWDWNHEEKQFMLAIKPIDLHLHSVNLRKDSIETGNPNEPFLLSPIITGFKKTQRLSLPPFNAYNNSFFNDCLECDTWLIIGYSFSDSHLNNLMKTAISHRREIPKIIYIDKQDVNNLKNGYNLNANFQDIFNGQVYKIFDKYKYIDDYLFCSNDNKIFLYFDGFETFLRNNVWHSIL